MTFYKNYFEILSKCIAEIDHSLLESSIKLIRETSINKGKTIIVGNGGSAAMASHVAVDLTKNAGIRAINFNEADLITCFSNDYGYEEWVRYALRSYADKWDTVILISSSGSSKNILNGAQEAKDMGLNLITVSGFSPDNKLRRLGDINLFVDSKAYNIVEMTHHVWLLAITDKIIGNIEYSAQQ